MASPFPEVDGLPATYLEFGTGPAPHWPAKTPTAARRIKGVETGPGRVSPPRRPWAEAPPGTDHPDLAALLGRVAIGVRRPEPHTLAGAYALDALDGPDQARFGGRATASCHRTASATTT
jgi:hypothetical protein